MHANCQNSVPQELIWVLSWNFQRMLKGDDHVTKRQYVHTTADTTVTATFTTTTSIAIIFKAKSIEIKISRSIRIYRLSKGQMSNVMAMANFTSNINTTATTTITTMPKGAKAKFSRDFEGGR